MSQSNNGEIEDGKVYTLKRLMDICGWDDDRMRTARQHLLHSTPPVRHRKVGTKIFVTGEAFRHWVQQGESSSGQAPPDEEGNGAVSARRKPRGKGGGTAKGD